MTFSLVELSFLVRILIEVDKLKITKNYERGLLKILRDHKEEVLDRLNKETALGVRDQAKHTENFERISNSDLIENMFEKVKKVYFWFKLKKLKDSDFYQRLHPILGNIYLVQFYMGVKFGLCTKILA